MGADKNTGAFGWRLSAQNAFDFNDSFLPATTQASFFFSSIWGAFPKMREEIQMIVLEIPGQGSLLEDVFLAMSVTWLLWECVYLTVCWCFDTGDKGHTTPLPHPNSSVGILATFEIMEPTLYRNCVLYG